MDFTPLNVAFAILGISLLVVVHEAGHYLAARAFGMRVLRFSIGLGPVIWKRQAKNSPTIFQVCALPLLAYVQIDGMNPAETIDPKDDELYPNKGVFARIVTIFAGPLANYLAAGVMVFALCLVGGWPETEVSARVAKIAKPSAAHAAGVLARGKPDSPEGDVFVEANGQPVTDGESLKAVTEARPGMLTRYVVERVGADGERRRVPLEITPMDRDGTGTLGVQLHAERVFTTVGVREAAYQALNQPYITTVRTLGGIAQLIERRSTQDVTSVVGMTDILAKSLSIAPQLYIWLLIQLSVALGLFNLLPFPALDGGRLAFLGYEVITRRRANERVEAAVHTVGLLLLLGVLVLVMGRDILRLT